MHVFDLLRIRNETFVREIDFHWTLESTNTHALQATSATNVVPRLVLANRQTSGRGRGDNEWLSSDGGLTFSLVIAIEAISPQHLPQISLMAGLAVCEALESFAPAADLALKWPNDVYLNGRKIAGILIEIARQPQTNCVIGIGLNVNNQIDGRLSDIATSLTVALNRELSLTDVLIACLRRLEDGVEQLQTTPERLVKAWREYDYLSTREVQIDAYGKTIRGTACGIDASGALRIQTQNGIESCLGGIVKIIDAQPRS